MPEPADLNQIRTCPSRPTRTFVVTSLLPVGAWVPFAGITAAADDDAEEEEDPTEEAAEEGDSEEALPIRVLTLTCVIREVIGTDWRDPSRGENRERVRHPEDVTARWSKRVPLVAVLRLYPVPPSGLPGSC